MSFDIGIIGLPQSGRTTVFNSLTGGQVDTAKHGGESSAHIGTALVPEPRLTVLSDLLKPNKVVPVSTTYIDIGASVKDIVMLVRFQPTVINRQYLHSAMQILGDLPLRALPQLHLWKRRCGKQRDMAHA